MRKRLFLWELGGFLFTGLAGTLLHFAYEWSGGSVWTAPFSAVNESTWEHMKLLFFPLFFCSVVQACALGKTYSNFLSVRAVSTLTGLALIPILYYTYTGILGRNFLPLDIGVFMISVILAFTTVYRLTLTCKTEHFTGILWLAVAILGLCFVWFTYHPPGIDLLLFTRASFQ